MRGRLFVDNIDVFERWGVYVTKGGWNDLIEYPAMKQLTYNDWQEEDGIEVDLSSPKLDKSDVNIYFAYSGLLYDFWEFIQYLSNGSYHTFNCASIGRTYVLRMSKMPTLSKLRDLGKVSISFYNDFPLRGYEYRSPVSNLNEVRDYLLDDVPFTAYGCRVLKGTLDTIKKMSDVKKNLTIDNVTISGALYDNSVVTFSEKEITVSCLMRAESLEELWRNYDALLYHLIQPNERMLKVASLEQELPCYYKKSSVLKFFPRDKIWLQFDIVLVVTGSLRIDTGDIILADETGIAISTEGSETFIDLAINA